MARVSDRRLVSKFGFLANGLASAISSPRTSKSMVQKVLEERLAMP